MSDLIQTLLGGLAVGGVYALISLGMSLVYSMSRVINLAQGAFVVLAALVAVSINSVAHLNPVLLLIVVAAILAAMFAAVDLVVIRPGVKRTQSQRMLLITIGLLQAVGGVLLIVWGNLPYTMQGFSNTKSMDLGGVHVDPQYFWIIGVLLVSLVALWLLLNRTGFGLTMRATAEDARAAALQGVNVDVVRLVTFSIGGAMAGLAGTSIVPLTFMQYDTVVPYAVNGFIAAVIGGLGSSSGAVLGGVLLGLLNAVFSRYLSADVAQVLAIAVLLVVLLVRPSGIRGKAVEARL
ncbi:branched-chain amino acid ABC transporter permease [Sinomonas soli]